jgi:beta-1,4-mannosyl-glycoprotein beta-1,4-N-acetylglucosaminyltransferase
MSVFDCFLLHNEIDIALLRINELRRVVDFHVICEARETHSGIQKSSLAVDTLMLRLPQWAIEKIIVVKVDTLSDQPRNAWEREAYHRSCIAWGLEDAQPDDLVIVSDCDEIPRPDSLLQVKDKAGLSVDLYYYNFNNRVKQFWGMGAARWGVYQDVCGIRTNAMGGPQIENAGWHLSYFGGADVIEDKVKSFMHYDIAQQTGVTRERIEEATANHTDLYGRGEMVFEYTPIGDGSHLPQYVQANIGMYKNMGWIK